MTSIKEAFHRCKLLTVLYQGSAKIKLLASRRSSIFCLFSLLLLSSNDKASKEVGIGEKAVRAERSRGQSNKILMPQKFSM
jgi:hypothetical protein